MTTEVGSMQLVGGWTDAGLLAGLARAKQASEDAASSARNVGTEFERAQKSTNLLTKALGLISLGGLASLLLAAPRTSAQLERMKTYLSLIANIMDEHVSPAVRVLVDQIEKLYHWFKNLSKTEQAIVTWGVVATAALISVGLAAGILGASLKGLGLSGAIASLGKFASAALGSAAATSALAVAAGLLLGYLGILALDRIGFFEWISNLGAGFRQAVADGNALAMAIQLCLTPLALMGSALMSLAGLQSWGTFKQHVRESIDLLKKFIDTYSTFSSVMGFLGAPMTGGLSHVAMKVYQKHDVGGIASYTGLHYLKAGEVVSTKSSSGSGEGDRIINIVNNFGDVLLQNGMDFEQFVEKISRTQAERVAWFDMR